MKKTLSNKQKRTAKKQFPSTKRAEHTFTPQDCAALEAKRGN